MFIDSEIKNYKVVIMCRVMQVSRSGYYAYKSRCICKRSLEDANLKKQILSIYQSNRSVYGTSRIVLALARQNVFISRRRCARLMRELDIRGVAKRKKRSKVTSPSKRRSNNVVDLVKRKFAADEPNRLWFADITYVRTYQGWIYLAVVFDIFSRFIVGWSIDLSMSAKLVDDALKMGVKRRKPAKGLIHHSDHGSQFCSLLLSKTLAENGIIPSMGAISAPGDNAACESLMSTIKAECTDIKTYETQKEATLDIFDYIEVFYNRFRMHSSIGYMSPKEFEEMYYASLAKAG